VENIIVPSWPGIHHEKPSVYFTNHDIDFVLGEQEKIADWIRETIEEEGFQLGRIDYIFCSDNYLLEINRKHLGHDDFTDIITFPLEENPVTGG